MVIFVGFFHFILFAKKARICDFNVKYLKSQEKLANIKTQENIKYSIEEIRKNVMSMKNPFKSTLKKSS